MFFLFIIITNNLSIIARDILGLPVFIIYN
jgi:hypothetical protein